jgi:hypothetical protein
VAVDEAGNAAIASRPVSYLGLAWKHLHIDSHPLTGVDCRAICVAVDDAGGVLVAEYPWDGEWTRTVLGGGDPLKDVSCARNSPFCAVLDEEGNVFTSTDPREAGWAVIPLAVDALDDISCPLQELCVATDDGSVLVSTEPAGGLGVWTESYVNAGSSISCVAEGVCVSVREDNAIVGSTEPLAGAGAWSESQIAGVNGLDEVSCGQPVSGTPCVATTFGGNGSPGNVLETRHPTDGSAAWLQANVYGLPILAPDPGLEIHSRDLTGVSCANEGLCVVVDAFGRALIGDGTALPGIPPEDPEVEPPGTEKGAADAQRGDDRQAPPVAGSFQIKQATVHCGGEIVLSLYAPAAGTFRARAKVTAAPDASSSRRAHGAVTHRSLSQVENRCDTRPRLSHGKGKSDAPLYHGASTQARAAGMVRIAIRPRSPLLASHRLKVRVAITYLPRDGGRLTKRKTLPIG